jgi:hypothetical protein
MPERKNMRKALWMAVTVVLVMAGAAQAAVYRVALREAAVRKDMRFFAPVVVRAPYGAQLQSSERKGDWLKVSYQGRQGWIHVSAVQDQKLSLSSLAGGRATESTRDEVALAGKGFTPEVEKAFQAKNPALNFAAVDRIESYRVPDDDLETFMLQGKLTVEGGAR